MPVHPERAQGQEAVRKRGKPLCAEEKWMVIKVFSCCAREREQSGSVHTVDPYQRTATYTGSGVGKWWRSCIIFAEQGRCARRLGQVIVFRIRQRFPLARPRSARIHSDEALRGGCHYRPSCSGFSPGGAGPRGGSTNDSRSPPTPGFQYTRTKTKSRALHEKPYVRQQRHTFLHDIRSWRKAGYQAVYIDESFLHHHHGNQFSWFCEGDFLQRPTGKGRRWCFIHALREQGLVSGAFRIFEAKKSRGDYHGMFNAESFLDWWRHQLLPNLPPRCVIVVDQASYHLVPEEQVMPSTMRKAELQQWLSSRNLAWEPDWLRPRLQQELEEHIDKTPLITKLAAAQGHRVLVLPVHHPELNPIELVWAIVKNECARLLRTGTQFKEVRQHLETAFARLSPTTCQKLYETVRQTEATYWKLDEELDERMVEQTGDEREVDPCFIT